MQTGGRSGMGRIELGMVGTALWEMRPAMRTFEIDPNVDAWRKMLRVCKWRYSDVRNLMQDLAYGYPDWQSVLPLTCICMICIHGAQFRKIRDLASRILCRYQRYSSDIFVAGAAGGGWDFWRHANLGRFPPPARPFRKWVGPRRWRLIKL